MEQIELVIKMPKYVYDMTCDADRVIDADSEIVANAIKSGIPLPKGHGALKDTDKLIKDTGLDHAKKYGNKTKEELDFSYGTMMMYEIFDLIDDAETIVEEDKEGSEEE